MGRVIALWLAVLTTSVLLSPQAKAQQANSRQTQDTAMAAAAGAPDFQRTGFATVGLGAAARRKLSPGPPTGAQAQPAGQAKAAGSFPPQPYVIPKGEGDAYVPPRLKTNFGKTPSTLNLSGNDYMQEPVPDKTGYDEKMRARAASIFPDDEAKRQQWMADQEQRAIANEINRTKPLLYPVSGR